MKELEYMESHFLRSCSLPASRLYAGYKKISFARKVLFGIYLLHMLFICMVYPYALRTAVDPYALSFPSSGWMRATLVISAMLVTSSALFWFYNYYIPCMFARYKTIVRVFILFLIGYYILYNVSIYPYIYSLDGDYTALMDMAQHGYSLLWQGYLTSLMYLSCFMCFVHPASVSIVLSVSYAVVFGHIVDICCQKADKCHGAFARGTVKLLLVLSGIYVCIYYDRFYMLFLIPHRISFWSIPFILMICCIASADLDADYTVFNWRPYMILSAATGLLAYWRMECILLPLLPPVCLAVSAYTGYVANRRADMVSQGHGKVSTDHRHTGFWHTFSASLSGIRKKLVTGILLAAAVYLLAALPDKTAGDPVYKNDYMLVNFSGWLQGMLKEADFDITYEGGNDDLDLFYRYVCEDILDVYGSGAWHSACEARTGNCTITGMDDAERTAYTHAVLRIVKNNLPAFVRSRFYTFLLSNRYVIDDSSSREDYYDLYLTGYGGYHSRILSQYEKDMLMPVYFNDMLSSYKAGIKCHTMSLWQIFFICTGGLILLYWIHLIIYIPSYVWKSLTKERPMQTLLDTVLDRLIFLSAVVISFLCGMLYHIADAAFIQNMLSDTLTAINAFAELTWSGIIFFCFLPFAIRKKKYMIALLYALMLVSMLPIALFAPMTHFMYYNGIMSALTLTGVLQLICGLPGTRSSLLSWLHTKA